MHMAWPDPQYSLRALSECQNSVLNNRLQSAAVPLQHNNGMGTPLSVLLALASTRKARNEVPPLIAFSSPRATSPSDFTRAGFSAMIDYVPAHHPPSAVGPRSSALCARATSRRGRLATIIFDAEHNLERPMGKLFS